MIFINRKVDAFSSQTILGIAITLYQYVHIDKRYSIKKKEMYKERMLNWIRKYNIPLELVVEGAVKQ